MIRYRMLLLAALCLCFALHLNSQTVTGDLLDITTTGPGSLENSYVIDPASCCSGVYIDYQGGPLVYRIAGQSSFSPLTMQSNGTVVVATDAIYNDSIINTNGHELMVGGGILCEEAEIKFDDSNINPVSVFFEDAGGTEEIYRLDASGKVWCTEVEVRIDGFPDYVFDPLYDLISLNELRRYIVEFGHLPGVPSAEEIETNGIGVSELQLLQMQKIEELTLYIFQLEEKIQHLQTMVESEK